MNVVAESLKHTDPQEEEEDLENYGAAPAPAASVQSSRPWRCRSIVASWL